MTSIRPHSGDSDASRGHLSLSPNAAGAIYLQALPSQAWQLQQELTISPSAPFTATLTATDTTSSWLAQFINTTTVTLTGSGPGSANLTIESIECDLVHPAPATGPSLLKLNLSTSREVLHRQFGSWDASDAGLELFGHEGGIVFGVKDVPTQGVTVGSLVALAGIHISPWASKVLSLLSIKLTNTGTPRNGLWIFAQQRQAILRLEFELDPKDIPATLMDFLPEHAEVALSVTVKKSARFGLFRPDPEVNGEVFLAGSVSFAATTFKQAKLDLYVFLGTNGTTYTIQNEGEVGFEEMLEVFAEHVEKKLEESSVHTAFQELKDRLDNHLGITPETSEPSKTENEKPSGKAESPTKQYTVMWHEFSLTITNDCLASISMTLEVDTPFGVPSGRSAFLFTFQWSLLNKEISLQGRFWPNLTPGQSAEPKMTLGRLLNPAEEKHAIYIQRSSQTQSRLSLVHLYPGFSIAQVPSWVPQEIVTLGVTLSTTEISLNAVVESATSTDSPEWMVPEKTQLNISFRYMLRQKDSMTFSIGASVDLPPPLPSSSDIATAAAVTTTSGSLAMQLSYSSPLWTISASARQLSSAHLYSLLPQAVRDEIVRMMPAVRLPALIVNYTCGGTSNRHLSVSGFLVVGGLLLQFVFQHDSAGDWEFVASLESSPSQAAKQTTTIQSIVERLLGVEAKNFLPDFVSNVTVPLEELQDDSITLTITQSADVGVVFGFEVRLVSLHLDLAQMPSSSPSAPKRLLRLSINEFPQLPNIPLVGHLPQPFDQMGFIWTTEDFTAAQIGILNAILYTKKATEILVRQSNSPKDTDVVLKKGLHFMLAMNKDGQPTVVIDYVFGKPASKKIADTAKNEENTGAEEGGTTKTDEVEKVSSAEADVKKTEKTDDGEISQVDTPASEMTPVSKKIKTLSISNIGLQMTDHILTVHLNATVKLGPIEMAMNGFALHFDLSQAHLPHLDGIKPSFSLGGLAIAYDRSPLHIAGLFLHQKTSGETVTSDTFAGGVVIGMSSYSFAAVGAYSEVTPKKPEKSEPFKSFFIFGALTGPLMHFEVAELRGISGGFGYNSVVNLPKVDAVTTFPFLTISNDSGHNTGDPMQMLGTFTDGQTIVPQTDALWFAAGLKLRAFELVDITAVVSLQLSQGDPVLSILADATAVIPQSAPSVDKAFAFLDFGLIATLDLSHGTLIIQGQLSPQSFLLSSKCHPTGGFALGVWSPASGHSGDLCFSVGGFHPAFTRPAHYPTAPARLGISWAYDAHISICGGAYYAITPAAIMAGASIQVLFAMDKLEAHFEAHADFLLEFEPLHYEASIGILAGVSYTLGRGWLSKKFSLSLSADLDLHGPPMAGTASFSCHVVTFHVSFGNSHPEANPITLQEFWDLLSKGSKESDNNHVMAVDSGLIPQNSNPTNSKPGSLVRSADLCLSIQSRTPISTAVYAGKSLDTDSKAIHSRPMQLRDSDLIESKIEFEILPRPERDFTISFVPKQVPASMWGRYDGPAALNASEQTIQHTMGVRLAAPPPVEAEDKLPILDEEFFGRASEIVGELVCTSTITSSSTGGAASPTAPSGTAPREDFSSVRNAWKTPTINPLPALQAFIALVTDRPAFGTAHAPKMSPSASWKGLEACVAPPGQYIDRMEEYYLRAPKILAVL